MTSPVIVCLNQTTDGSPALSKPEEVPGIPYVFWGPKVRVVDWNQDGDEDLMIQSEFLSFWAEKSFLTNGYSPGKLISDTDGHFIHTRK